MTADLYPPSTQQILGLPFFVGGLDEVIQAALNGGLVMAPSGPNLAGEFVEVPAYRDALWAADYVLTDSAVMVSTFSRRTGVAVPRHSGLKFLEALLREPSLRREGSVFWVMPSRHEGDRIARWLRGQGLQADETNTYCAPFYNTMPIQDQDLADLLREARPRVVVINLAGGKQEVLGAWLKRSLIDPPGIICTGAAIAFLAGTQANIPTWTDRAGLGWLARCVYEPGRYVPRYLRALPLLTLIWRYRDRLPPMRATA